MNIYVGNLHFKMSENELRSLFENYGEVVTAKIIMDKATGRSKGFGFVEMINESDANAALTSLDGKDVSGRAIKVTIARERENTPHREYKNNGNFERKFHGGQNQRDISE